MKKDDIIALLGEQLKATTEQLRTALGQLKEANAQVSALTATVGELTARIESLEKMLTEKGVALDKMERISKALGNMVSGKKSERQKTEEDKAPMTMEEYQKMLEQRAATTMQGVTSIWSWKPYMLTWNRKCPGTRWPHSG